MMNNDQTNNLSNHTPSCGQHKSLSDGSRSCACTLHQISESSLFQLNGTPTTGGRRHNHQIDH